MDNLKFSCPKCGNRTFKTASEVKTYDDFLGATCTKCGRAMTDEDVKKQARKIAEDLVRDAF
jgi:transcription elongation factor Elf1